MSEKWKIEKFAYFFSLLVNATDASGKNILEKRFKKDPEALRQLLELLKMIGELGYKDGIRFAFNSSYFDSIKGPVHNLIEIRRFCGLWRVLSFNSMENELVVMLDAFEAHKHKSTTKAAQSVSSKAKITKELLERNV